MTWTTATFKAAKSFNVARLEKAQALAKIPQRRGPFKCSRCDSEFGSKRNRRRHGKREHREPEPEEQLEPQIPKSECHVIRRAKLAPIRESPREDAKIQVGDKSKAEEQVKRGDQARGKTGNKAQDMTGNQAQGKTGNQVQAEAGNSAQGKPENRKRSKTTNQEQVKGGNRRQGKTAAPQEAGTWVQNDPIPQDKVKPVNPLKPNGRPRMQRTIPRDIRKGCFELYGRRKQLYDNRKLDDPEYDLRPQAENATSVTNQVRTEKKPELYEDRRSNRSCRAQAVREDVRLYRKLVGLSSNDVANCAFV